jgi:germination protein M
MKLYGSLATAALTAAFALAAGGCGGETAESAGPVPSDRTETEVETTPEGSKSYRVWLTRGEHLFRVWRQGAETEGVGAEATRLLLEGPTAEEAQAGVSTAIPAGTRFLSLDIDGTTATVDLTSEYESGGGSASMFARLAQVVYTLTEFDTVKQVRFMLDGQPVDVFSGEGIILEEPVGRRQYSELMPAILIESPRFGAVVHSPFEVKGSANVFEANVTVRLLDRNGKELVSRFTTATCGTGCRGRYSIEIPYQAAVDQPGTLVAQDDDADGDGKPSFEVRIPVTISQG